MQSRPDLPLVSSAVGLGQSRHWGKAGLELSRKQSFLSIFLNADVCVVPFSLYTCCAQRNANACLQLPATPGEVPLAEHRPQPFAARPLFAPRAAAARRALGRRGAGGGPGRAARAAPGWAAAAALPRNGSPAKAAAPRAGSRAGAAAVY